MRRRLPRLLVPGRGDPLGFIPVKRTQAFHAWTINTTVGHRPQSAFHVKPWRRSLTRWGVRRTASI